MADSANPFATLVKITQTRAEELALLALASRYQLKGFDARAEELQSWYNKTAKEISEPVDKLKGFYAQFIIPNLPDNRMTDTPKVLDPKDLGRIALKLVYLECADFRTLDARVAKFLKRHPMVSRAEVMSLVTHYLVPFYFEKLQHAERKEQPK